MNIDPPGNKTRSPTLQTNVTAELAQKLASLPQLEKLLQQLPANKQRFVVATVVANHLVATPSTQGKNSSQQSLYQVVLKIGDQKVHTVSSIDLKPGHTLQLEINPSKGLAIRRIDIDTSQYVRDALKVLTPKQENISQLFLLLSQSSQMLQEPANQKEASLQQQLKIAINQLLGNTPRLQYLRQPKVMEQVLKSSGLFHENSLKLSSIGRTNSQLQLKAALLAAKNKSENNSSTQGIQSSIQLDLKGQLRKLETQLTELKRQSTEIENTAPVNKQVDKTTNKSISSQTEQTHSRSNTQTTDNQTQKGESKMNSPASNLQAKDAAKFAQLQPSLSTTKSSVQQLPRELINSPYFEKLKPYTKQNTSGSQSAVNANINNQGSSERVIENLLRQTQSALARIQLNQLTSLTQSTFATSEANPIQQWIFEVPINTGNQSETVHILIKEEENSSEKKNQNKQKCWCVHLEFDLTEFGKLHMELSLVGDNASSTIWVEQCGTYKSVKQRLDQLQNKLEAIGLKVEKMACHNTLPAQSKFGISTQLIDINT